MGHPGTTAFLGGDDAIATLVANWWDNVDRSERWQYGIFYTLCAAYSLVSIVSLAQVVRIHLRMQQTWSIQKVFHFMNFIVTGLRAILFGLYHSIFLIRPKIVELVLIDLPGLLFFSTYTLLVLFWAGIYHQARGLPSTNFQPSYLIINGVVYLIQVGIWIFGAIHQGSPFLEIARVFFAVVSFIAALGFLIYGGRLFILLRNFPIESRNRQKKLNEVGFLTTICFTCFLLRCIMVAISAFDKDADPDVLDHPLLDLMYYSLVEIIPSALVLFVLRKIPSRRAPSQRYQAIG